MSVLGLLMDKPEVVDLMRCIGTCYWWGRGFPGAEWPPASVDCSGWAQMALVRMGCLRPEQPDRVAHDLAMACDPVTLPTLGCLAFYGVGKITHVMVHLDAEWVIGASGGDSKTMGQDPTAYVMLKRTHYRRDLKVSGRIKLPFRPTNGADDMTP